MVRNFPPDKNDDAGGLSPGEKEDAYWRKKARHNLVNFIRVSYQSLTEIYSVKSPLIVV